MSMWPKHLNKQDEKFLRMLHVAVDAAPDAQERADSNAIWSLICAEKEAENERLENELSAARELHQSYRGMYEREAQDHVETLVLLTRWQWAAAIGWSGLIIWTAIKLGAVLCG